MANCSSDKVDLQIKFKKLDALNDSLRKTMDRDEFEAMSLYGYVIK